ncbi:hypothetical protein NHX12_006247 [Muraenolepis orangiensis]|uniref:Uncharacterized protein n=1 Tax=Muraenolepis orangiensis TaxID=630683 RepID=A0A9Q0DQN8_9TELE|nr:hypothetical protein NHX12_006247 [Muraenolepis orangiensis]
MPGVSSYIGTLWCVLRGPVCSFPDSGVIHHGAQRLMDTRALLKLRPDTYLLYPFTGAKVTNSRGPGATLAGVGRQRSTQVTSAKGPERTGWAACAGTGVVGKGGGGGTVRPTQSLQPVCRGWQSASSF